MQSHAAGWSPAQPSPIGLGPGSVPSHGQCLAMVSWPPECVETDWVQDYETANSRALVQFPAHIPDHLKPQFEERFRSFFSDWQQEALSGLGSIAFGSFLVYLERQEMGDKEKKRLLQAFIAAAQGTAAQLGLPELDSPTLQIGNSLYSLSASGNLEARHLQATASTPVSSGCAKPLCCSRQVLRLPTGCTALIALAASDFGRGHFSWRPGAATLSGGQPDSHSGR